jgi:hypothetical protein
MLGNSEIGELVHFQVIGDILHVFRLSQHGAYVFLRLPHKIKTKIKTSNRNTHTHTHTHTHRVSLLNSLILCVSPPNQAPQILKSKNNNNNTSARVVSLPTLLIFLHQIKLHKPWPHTQNKEDLRTRRSETVSDKRED